jgi:gliding motility-associated-like protein
MKRATILISILFVFFSSDLFAQIDSVTFNFHRGISIYEFSFIAQNIDNGDTTAFSPTDANYSFRWYIDLVEQTNDTLAVFRHKFQNEGNYTVDLDVYDIPNNITISASRIVPVRDTIIVPNVFSPNGDDYNEQFIVRANGITPLEISIFSRTGMMVYKAKAPVLIWDGRNSSGSEMSEGIYYYILKSDDPNVPERTGFIHLYR